MGKRFDSSADFAIGFPAGRSKETRAFVVHGFIVTERSRTEQLKRDFDFPRLER